MFGIIPRKKTKAPFTCTNYTRISNYTLYANFAYVCKSTFSKCSHDDQNIKQNKMFPAPSEERIEFYVYIYHLKQPFISISNIFH